MSKENEIEYEHSPLKAIRAKCLDCSCDSISEVKNCPIVNCPIYPFRFGKNPFTKRELTPEQREAAAERLKEARGKKTT